MKSNILVASALLLGIACQPTKQNEQAVVSTEAASIPKLVKTWETDTTLTTCESVIYDELRDVLYVSNINGVPPTAKDGDGFISIISTDGEVINLNWVTEISAPKGMGIVDSSLFVTNIDEVVEIDIPSGVIVKRYPVTDAQFLNDIATSSDGDVFISDSNQNTIHQIKNGEISLWLSDSSLQGSNGLLHQGSHIMVASYGGGDLYRVDINTQMKEALSDSIKGGDGIVALTEGYLVSSWSGEIHFVHNSGTRTQLLDTKAINENAADICYVNAKNLLLVPTFFGNKVVAYEVN
ncbi:MAG: ATP-binding protein [Reichenbachiella sp.]|uniref:ATP-binding protein n=1 Tax=Reichenbachiella sp. TaxID=2184521 RepID=UPI0032649B19